MISRHVATLLAASLLEVVMCAGAYGQPEYQNQPAGRNPGGGISNAPSYVPSVPSANGQSEYQNQPAGRNPGSENPSAPIQRSPSVYGQPEYQNQPAGRNPGGYYVQPASGFTGQQPASTPGTGLVSADVLNNGTAMLKVHLPADAKLYFGTTESTGPSGSMRLFRSPSLDPGSNYQYYLRARWTENGNTVERTRNVPVHANDVVNVDFTHGG